MGQIQNAIIMAAGKGMRLRPLTEKTPKPLLPIGDRTLIETVLDALTMTGVEKLYVVTGYLGDQFQILTNRYENLRLIRNPDYDAANNISSVYYAREVLRQGACMICEADLYLRRPEILREIPDHSCYYGMRKPGYSDDWVFDTGKDGYITRVGKGGTDCYNMVGLSFFTKEDAAILSDCIQDAYSMEGLRDLFWDEVVDRNLKRLRLRIRSLEEGSITEIDTCEEYYALTSTMK